MYIYYNKIGLGFVSYLKSTYVKYCQVNIVALEENTCEK